MRELVALPPAARAARRLAWLTAPGRRDPGWVAAVRTVLRTDLPLAQLEPRLFDWYSLNALPQPVPAVPEGSVRPPRADRELVPFRRAESVATAAAAPAAAGGCECLSGPGAVLFAVIVVVRILVAVGGSSSRTTSPPHPLNYQRPAYQQPAYQPHPTPGPTTGPAWPTPGTAP